MSSVLIVGFGVVGENISRELRALSPDIYDKYKPGLDKKTKDRYDLAIICVDTPITEDDKLDITEVRNAINENDSEIYIIKSTCPPGTAEQLKTETCKRIIFSPEYYGNTQHNNNYDFDFTILGGDKQDCIDVIQILQQCYDARHRFRITDSRTAELAKLMENSYLAAKVSFCNQFYNICGQQGVNYEELRELFILDPRVNPSHTFVYRDHPYWDSHCLNKDVRYTAYGLGAPLMQDVISFNNAQKSEGSSNGKHA